MTAFKLRCFDYNLRPSNEAERAAKAAKSAEWDERNAARNVKVQEDREAKAIKFSEYMAGHDDTSPLFSST
jgi:hypothetical protein